MSEDKVIAIKMCSFLAHRVQSKATLYITKIYHKNEIQEKSKVQQILAYKHTQTQTRWKNNNDDLKS